MKNKIQREKAEIKTNSIYNLIYGLIDYNDIDQDKFDNSFNITIDTQYSENKKCYVYTVNIYKNNEELVGDLHISYRNRIDDLLEKLILALSNHPKVLFAYEKRNKHEKNCYTMVFNSGVNINFNINDEDDRKFYKELDKKVRFTIGTIRSKRRNTSRGSMDETAAKISLKAIRMAIQVFDSMVSYNSIEGYNNTKDIRLIIENNYDSSKDINRYSVKVVRGSVQPKTLINLEFSLKNNSVLYEDFYNTIMRYLESNLLCYPFNVSYGNREIFGIKLKNNTELNFKSNSDKDKEFFKSFKENKEIDNDRRLIYEQKKVD